MAVDTSHKAGPRAPRHLRRPLHLAIGLSISASAVFAQSNEATSTTAELQTVVVSASGFEQDVKQAPASISVITREDLQTRSYTDLADALKDVEGIDVRGSTGKTGGLDISIRGMPSEYTLVLIDGRRQNVAGDVTPNGFSAALTSLIPPLSAIERIEVIRGPMSTLYGSDALGGVINIITRKVAREWGGSVQLEAGMPGNSDVGNTHKTGFYLSGPLKEEVLGLVVRGNLFDRGGSTLASTSGGGAISSRGPSPVGTRQGNLGARLNLTPDRYHDFWLDVDASKSRYDNAQCQLGTLDYLNCGTGNPTTTVNGYASELQFNREQFAIGHTGRFSLGTLDTSLMRNVTETRGRTIPTSARPARDPSIGSARVLEQTNTVLDTKLVSPLGDKHILTTGAQIWRAELLDTLVPSPYQQDTWAMFIEDEWRFAPQWAATLGLRHDQHQTFGGNLSPRGYLVWSATNTLTVKGGMARGFKAPSLNRLADGVSGISGQGRTISIGNPALEPEISDSSELALLFDNANGLTASATAFHNKINNRITNDGGNCAINPIATCVFNPTALYPVNSDQAKTWGLELATRLPVAQDWSLNMNYTWTDSELVNNSQYAGQLGDTAKHMANAALRWQASDQWAWWLRAEYRGASRRFDGDPAQLAQDARAEYRALGDLKGYGLLHLGGQHKVSKALTLNFNIFNLLDKNFLQFSNWTDSAGQAQWGSPYFKSTSSTKGSLPSGRTLWLSANVTF